MVPSLFHLALTPAFAILLSITLTLGRGIVCVTQSGAGDAVLIRHRVGSPASYVGNARLVQYDATGQLVFSPAAQLKLNGRIQFLRKFLVIYFGLTRG